MKQHKTKQCVYICVCRKSITVDDKAFRLRVKLNFVSLCISVDRMKKKSRYIFRHFYTTAKRISINNFFPLCFTQLCWESIPYHINTQTHTYWYILICSSIFGKILTFMHAAIVKLNQKMCEITYIRMLCTCGASEGLS